MIGLVFSLVVCQGTAPDVGADWSEVDELVPSDGGWALNVLGDLSGVPKSYTTDERGNLYVLAVDGASTARCKDGFPFRVDAQGRVEALTDGGVP